MGKLYAGIHFRLNDASGIAEVDVYNLSRGEYVIEDKLIDLYLYAKDATDGEYEDFVFWITLPYPDDEYQVTVSHSGTHNPASESPWAIIIEEYFIIESLSDGRVNITAYLTHGDHAGYQETFQLSDEGEFIKRVTISADGNTDSFAITGDNRALEPYRFGHKASEDVDITWKEIYDTSLSWGVDGSNQQVNTDGHFKVVFDWPPDAGEVYIEYYVKFNQLQMLFDIELPNDGVDYIDFVKPIRFVDYGLELV